MSLGWRKSNPSGSQFSGDPSTGKPLPSKPEADQQGPRESLPEVAVEVHSSGVAFLIRALDFFACEWMKPMLKSLNSRVSPAFTTS